MATSTFTSPGLIKATTDALIKATPELNLARLFAYDMSGEFAEVNATVKVPVVTAGAAADFDISTNDYENAGGSIDYTPVTLTHQPKVTMAFTGANILEAPNAPYWNKCAEAMANVLKTNISTALGGLFTTDACTGGSVTMASITKKAVAELRTECIGRINDTILGLSPTFFADLLALLDSEVYGGAEAIRQGYIPNLYGFKAVAPMYDLPDGVNGVLIGANSVVVASRAVAVADQSIYSEFGTASDDFGFTLTTMRHGSAAKGTGFINMSTLWGAKLIKPAEIVAITAA